MSIKLFKDIMNEIMKLEKRLRKTKDYDEYCYLSEKIEVLKKIIRYQ